jgi:hypothetical protein
MPSFFFIFSVFFAYTLQRKSHLCIPFLGIARTLSPNFHIHVSVSELYMYSLDRSRYVLHQNRQIDCGNI